MPLRRTQTWRLHTKLYNLGDTILQITREWNTAETWFLERLFIYQSAIVSQILDFIHWAVTIFSFDHMTGENRELGKKTVTFYYVSHACVENSVRNALLVSRQHGVSLQISFNVVKTFVRISCIRKFAGSWISARVFPYLLSFFSQILGFIYWTVLIYFYFDLFEWRYTETAIH